MKVTIDTTAVAQILVVGAYGYILAHFWSLPLYPALGLTTALVGIAVLNCLVLRKTADYIISLAAQVLSDQLQADVAEDPRQPHVQRSEQEERVQQELEKQSATTSTIRSSIVAWNQVQGNKFLHPRQMDIDEANKEMKYGVYGRYPLAGEKLALTFDEIVSSRMTVGRFVANSDATLYPVFAETSLGQKEFIKIFGKDICAKVDNYYYDTTNGNEFILLVFKDADPRTQYLLLRLPKDSKAKPFRYERLN